MKKILLIAGHVNIKFNSIASLHGSTGTAGEQELTIRITNRLATVLRDRGFEVTQSDANANDDSQITSKDFDLALALHGDMDVQNDKGGGMVGSGDKSVDAMWQESLRIKKVFDEVYFTETDIVNKNIVTAGMAKYYIWQYLTAKTPCVLIEMGQVLDPHDRVLLANTDLIANAIGRSICKAFDVPFDVVPSPDSPEVLSLKAEVKRLGEALDTQNKAIVTLKSEHEIELAKVQGECRIKIEKLKTDLLAVINQV